VWYVAIIHLGNLAHLTYGFWFYLAIWETRCLKLCAYLWMVLCFSYKVWLGYDDNSPLGGLYPGL
jgi:hypothetical protein